MDPRTRSTRNPGPAAAMTVVLLWFASPASARVTVAPWSGNIGFVSSKSTAGAVVDQQSVEVPGPAAWSHTLFTQAEDDSTESNAFATAVLASSFSDSVFAVNWSGFGFAEGPAATNGGGSLLYVHFAIERTQSYTNYPLFTAGTFASNRTSVFLLNLMSPDLHVLTLIPGETSTGRLPPGLYAYYFSSSYRDEPQNGVPDGVSSQIGFYEVAEPLVTQHPQSQTVAAGSTASFQVNGGSLATTDPDGGPTLTYQWRYRLAPLTNGGRISGATSSELQISGVTPADSGVYDCVVTATTLQSIEEPSSLARLTVTGGTTAVEDPARLGGLSLAAPTPNPSRGKASLHFTLPRTADVTLEVLDVSGRVVRTLLSGGTRAAGAHAIEWDGLDARGTGAHAGLYFVRLRAGQEQRLQRVVRLQP